MVVTTKKAAPESFVKSLVSVLVKYECFGTFNKDNPCVYCNIVKQCKEHTPRRVKA